FQRTYKDRGFTVVGIAMDDDGWDVVRPWAERRKINYPTAIATEQLRTIYGGVENLPTTFIIDKEGRIAATHVGLVSRGTYQKAIEALIEERVVSALNQPQTGVIPRQTGEAGYRRSPRPSLSSPALWLSFSPSR